MMKPLIRANKVIGTFASEAGARKAIVSLVQGMDDQGNVLREAAAKVELQGAQVTVSWNNKPTIYSIITKMLRNTGASVSDVLERDCS